MLSGSLGETMLGLVRRAALPIEARATREAMLGREAVSRRLLRALPRTVAARASQKPPPRCDRSELHKGRMLKAAGDGMLIEFANAVEAARLAAG
jgi:hypothetical protein